ncbi:MAG: DUF169 domain-containing protein [Bryobacteraceae bacterium]|nr:DUF169 domain-containing protein [Bryobacteraceae bacterium]
MTPDYQSLATRLTSALSLTQPPVAISFADEVPAGTSEYSGRAPAGCSFWQEALQGSFATQASDHSLCAIGVHTHNLQPEPSTQSELGAALKVFASLGYVREEDVPLIPVLGRSFKHVIYSPLSAAEIAPDVVLLFVDAVQSLVLVEAAQQVENQTAPAMGRPACAVVPQAVNSGRAALSLGCCGARAYLDVMTPGTALFAIPGNNIASYVDRVDTLSSANALLSRFHQIRRRDVEDGKSPSLQESLSAM